MVAISSTFFQRMEKLRRAAAKADVSNLVINPPLIVPPAWAGSTAYTTGDIRSNGGSWFVNAGPGTSAASGGPSNTTSGAATADGTTLWTYLGGPTISASDALAPTITTSSSTPSGLTNYWGSVAYPSLYRVLGANVATFASTRWKLSTFNRIAATAICGSAAVEFYTDAPKFAVGVTNNAPNFVRIAVDDRYLTVDHIATAAGAGDMWFVIDYGSVGQRKIRKVRVEAPSFETSGSFTFSGVRTTSNDTVYPPPINDAVKAVFISDSLFAGSSYGPFVIGGSTARRVSNLLGWDDCWDMSTGGTGHIATNGATAYNYGQRIADTGNAATIAAADVVTVMGSTNDMGQSGIAAAVTSEIQAIRALNAGCIINYIGVWSLNNAGVTTVESAVQSGVTAANDPRTFFTPIFADPTIPWITGAWNNSANSSSTNATMYISGDNTHPPDVGTAYLAQRIAKAFKTNVLPVAA